MRILITTLVRLSELPPWMLVLASAMGVALAYIERELQLVLPPDAVRTISGAGFVLALVPLLPVAIRDLNIWKLFPPRYHGINRAFDRIARRYASHECLYIGEDDRVRIDALGVLRQSEALLLNLDLAGTDRALQATSGRINAMAFSGTRYGLSADNKRDRNASLSAANPVTFALLRDGEGGHNGLAATLPLTEAVAGRYAMGRISDNDLSGAMIARPGEPVGAVVFFLIAHCRAPGRSRESLLPDTLTLLVETCLLQLVLIGLAAPDQDRFFALAANSDRKMQELFARLHLVPRPDYDNADQEDVFGNYVLFRKRADARAHLVARHPELAAMLGIAA